MKKSILFIVLGILLVLLGILLVYSHIGHDKNLDTINPGLYEIEFTLNSKKQASTLKMRVRYYASGIYTGRIYLNNVPVEELKGKYKVNGGRLKSFDKFIRVSDENGTWGPWKTEEPSSVSIRNISKDSYQYYLKAHNEKERARYAVLGIKEGWKTYKRIRP